MTSGELKVLMALDKLGSYIQNGVLPYKSIQGTFWQSIITGDITYTVLHNDSGYSFDIVNIVAGRVRFDVGGDSDIRNTLFFIGSPSHPTNTFSIENDLNSPVSILVYSYDATNAVTDPRGFGLDGATPISFELRFFPAA